MNIDSIINPVSSRPMPALPVILLGTLGLLYFGAIAPEVLSTWFPFTRALNPFVDAKLKHQTCPKSSLMSQASSSAS